MRTRRVLSTISMLAVVAVSLLIVFNAAAAKTDFKENASMPIIKIIDSDSDGIASPGDEVIYANGMISLRFRFVGLSTDKKKVLEKFNGYYLSDISYRGENIFSHPDWKTERTLYPTLITNDVVGMSAFTSDKAFRDEPFLWLWNNSKEPAKTITPDMKWFPGENGLQSWEYYTLYTTQETRGTSLAFIKEKSKTLTEEIIYTLDGDKLKIEYVAVNKGERVVPRTGIIVFPANRIIDTVYAPSDILVTRKIAPLCFSDSYTCAVTKTDGFAGSGMTFWSSGEDSLLHMDGIVSWHNFKVEGGKQESRSMEIQFFDQNIRKYYLGYLKSKNITFDTIDWENVEDYLVSKVPLSMDPQGFVYHAYDYNPPGTNHDWHNEMTGRAFVVQYLATGNSKWKNLSTRANNYYIEKMFHSEPHTCRGYFMDQTYADKQRDCYLWSQPYNIESLIAEYAVTKDKHISDVLMLNFEKIYSGPLYNKDGKRWYWQLYQSGQTRDFATFDAQEFGIDSMIQAYEFTRDRKYLDRAVEVMNGQKHVLDNFGLLLEDRAGESSVNTFAFAAKVLFKLYEYTGNKYWLDRAIKILDATIFSRVFMEAYSPQDAWLKGALSRKDGDWKNQSGPPTTGTDSSTPSQTSYIPWVMEALVAGYNHTGDELYIKYISQLLHHQIEANKKLLEATDGKFELCGHYNMYNKTFEMDNDGLTVVSNLFLFPYIKTFKAGVRSPHSSIVLMPGKTSATVRAFHLSGLPEEIKLIVSGRKVAKILKLDGNGKRAGMESFKTMKNGCAFKASPYSMYEIQLK